MNFLNTKFILVAFVSVFLSYCVEKRDKIGKENKTVALKKDRDTSVQNTPLVIWFLQPATQFDTIPYIHGGSTNVHGDAEGKGWDEALPIGNGRLGAMVFGGTKRERIQLNESTLWTGSFIQKKDPDITNSLSEIRKLIFEGKYVEASRLAEQKLTGNLEHLAQYQPLADLYIDLIDMDESTPVTDYYRDLHIDSALATVHFRANDKLVTREIFASYPDNVIVIKLKTDKPGGINAHISLMREAGAETFRSPFDSTLLIQRGAIAENNLLFETQVKAVYKGGTVRNGTRKLVCKNVDELILYISAATNYEYKDHAVFAKQTLLAAINKSYEQIRTDHIHSYKKLFTRNELTLNFVDKAYDLPTDKRILKAKNGIEDNYLTELLYQYGRYLLICSSRPNSYPANLQGIWNEHMNPVNGCGYQTAWSLPLIYSAADATGLSELKQPLHKLIDTTAMFGSMVANDMYQSKGWVAHDFVSLFGNNYPTLHTAKSIDHLGAVWLACMYYDSYLYNRDKEFLKNKAFPIIKGACEFVLSNLQVVPTGLPLEGKLVVCPSISNGNRFDVENGEKANVGYASTIDQMLAKDILSITLQVLDELSSKTYKFDPTLRAKAADALEKLAYISPEATELTEWLSNLRESDEVKDNLPPLYGLYPSSQISKYKTPEIAARAENFLGKNLLLQKNNSFMYPLGAIWYARLAKPEEADALLLRYIQNSISANLLSSNPPFSIDGSMAFTTAVAEMLVQSHEGFLNFAPALPSNWETGMLKGFVTRGGFKGTLEWNNAKIYVTISTPFTQFCKVYSETPIKVFESGNVVPLTKESEKIYVFEAVKDKKYAIAYAKRTGNTKKSSKGLGIWPDLGLGINLGINL